MASWEDGFRDAIRRSGTWKDISEKLFQAVQVALAESSPQSRTLYFTDLSDADKIAVVDRAVRSVVDFFGRSDD